MRPSAFLAGLSDLEALSVDIHAIQEGARFERDAAQQEAARARMRFR